MFISAMRPLLHYEMVYSPSRSFSCSPYWSVPAYRDLAGMVWVVCVPVNHRTGTYRPYQVVQGGTENLGFSAM
ncbi:hypothetical protein GW17_00029297 [Ensete ventricosum]|nr:hypothetical protein GW17_00029297 [Ensete ventricosum]